MSNLITKAEYDKLTPYQQGYACYMQSHWPGSEIPKECPYAEETKERQEFARGEFSALLDVQDIDDD